MGKKILGLLVLVLIVGGAVAGSKPTDPEILARIGGVLGQKVNSALPSRSQVAEPITAFRLGDRLPVEEQVRIRLHADKALQGLAIEVHRGEAPGEVRLSGIVRNAADRDRAGDIAANTVGVNQVINELAIPER
ncbi:MAG: BON domain-containing protein [Fimbriiglobus sp.]